MDQAVDLVAPGQNAPDQAAGVVVAGRGPAGRIAGTGKNLLGRGFVEFELEQDLEGPLARGAAFSHGLRAWPPS